MRNTYPVHLDFHTASVAYLGHGVFGYPVRRMCGSTECPYPRNGLYIEHRVSQSVCSNDTATDLWKNRGEDQMTNQDNAMLFCDSFVHTF